MNRRYSLKKNRQFQYVYRRGNNVATRELALVYVRAKKLEVGFSVSKKVGNAVVRNKIKRRLREAFRLQIPRLKPGLYVVAARQSAAGSTYQTLEKSLCYLLRKQFAYKDEGL